MAHVKLSDFASSGHTIEFKGVTYGVPRGTTDTMIDFVSLQRQGFLASRTVLSIEERATAEGWADDDERVMGEIRDAATEVKRTELEIRKLALTLLAEANDDITALDSLPLPHCTTVINLALSGPEDEPGVTADDIVATAIGLEAQVGLEGDADPPTKRKTGGTATMTPPRKRSATRSRKRS